MSPASMDEATATKRLPKSSLNLGVSDKKEMGRVIKEVLNRYRGQIDGKVVQKVVSGKAIVKIQDAGSV